MLPERALKARTRPLGEVMESRRRMLNLGTIDEAETRASFSQDVVARVFLETRRIHSIAIGYADVRADPLGVSRRVAAFMGGGLELAPMAGSVDKEL